MRIRATVAAASGALVLSALAVPSAQAATASEGDTKITKVVVNGGKNVAVGTSTAKTFSVSVTATDNSGIAGLDDNLLWLHGPGFGMLTPTGASTCTRVSATTSTCTANFTVDPKTDLAYSNDMAGTWYVNVWVDAKDGDYASVEKASSFKLQRSSKLTTNASPEPVVKGKTITVTGKLTRANWDSFTYTGYGSQPVKLQFKKAGTSTYTTVKTINTNSTGSLSTTVTAASDGYYRYSFAGTTTTPAVSATGDYIDVK
ncbi:calcium-binding protein [Streptomyces sp. NPDC056773]|uniref:calcium-binding protein n=1 Tax=unclassified Streptomyces TaxID=2593676 RepID=UPI0036A6FAFB